MATAQVTEAIVSAAEESVPTVTGSYQHKSVPWWTPEIAETIWDRQQVLQRHPPHPSLEYLLSFKLLRAQARRLTQHSKEDCWEQYVATIGYCACCVNVIVYFMCVSEAQLSSLQ